MSYHPHKPLYAPLGDITTVASAAAAIVSDPCLFEVSKIVNRLHALEQAPVKPGTKPPITPGIGLCSAVKPLRAVVYVKERPWVAVLGFAAVVGGIFGLGYITGKR